MAYQLDANFQVVLYLDFVLDLLGAHDRLVGLQRASRCFFDGLALLRAELLTVTLELELLRVLNRLLDQARNQLGWNLELLGDVLVPVKGYFRSSNNLLDLFDTQVFAVPLLEPGTVNAISFSLLLEHLLRATVRVVLR